WTTGDPTLALRKGAEFISRYADSLAAPPISAIEKTEEFTDYCVIHGEIDLPGFQDGAAPYILTGGDIDWDADGNPLQRYVRKAGFVVTIPKTQAMPTQGYPLLY